MTLTSFLMIWDWNEDPELVTDLLDLGMVEVAGLSVLSQVELVRLLEPDLASSPPTSFICLAYSLSSNIFLSPPPGRCFTLARDPILEPTWKSSFSLCISTLPPPGWWLMFFLLPTRELTEFQSSFLFSILTWPPPGLWPAFSREPIREPTFQLSFLCSICG